MEEYVAGQSLITLTADIVSAHIGHNDVAVAELPSLIASVHGALASVDTPQEPAPVKLGPAVPIRSSVKPDFIICLEDGKKVKMLKRYLMTNYQLTPDQYRAKWRLSEDYPMVAPNYAARRRELALKFGLGRKRKIAPPPPPGSVATRKRVGRKPTAKS
jgi:predicted transcriptional regulator